MNRALIQFLTSAASSNSGEQGSTGSSTESIRSALKDMVKSPAFYVVIGAIVFLIFAVYFFRRIVKPNKNSVTIITRKGSIHRLIDEKSSNYFRAPFIDKVGAVISLNERELTSDKLFINNGPDALYQINYTLKYKVTNPKEFYAFNENIQNLIVSKLNDYLRDFADAGNALLLVKDYRENSGQILNVINSALKEYSVEAVLFKINLIQPLGR